MARKGSYDFSRGLDTSGNVRRTSQETLNASRSRAAGAEPPPYDPVAHAKIGRQAESDAKRWVMGRYENKGRSPMMVLHPTQFAQFQQTGDWEGSPSPEDYGPQSMAPEDKEYETNF